MDSTGDDPLDGERLRRAWRREPGAATVAGALDRVCVVAVAELDLLAAAVTMLPTPSNHPVVASAGETARSLEDIQFRSGDGPSIEAGTGPAAVLAPDLEAEREDRWPGFQPAAVGSGVRAAFAFPLAVGAARFGALSMYRSRAGRLTRPELRTGFLLAELAVEILVDSALPEHDGAAGVAMGQAIEGHAQVYQAQGMIMVQLGVSLSEALARMRAHAYAHDLALAVLASDIVAGRTRLTKE